MSSHYDTYDYPSYWKGREYEHEAEIVALTSFFENIPKVETILEVGAGFGRLTPSYINKAEKVILSDPSQKLLNIAMKKIKDKKVRFIISDIENLSTKVKAYSIDIIVVVRVLHHVKDLEKAFSIVSNLLKPGGYFILEFPNKIHMKAVLSEFVKQKGFNIKKIKSVSNFRSPLLKRLFPKQVLVTLSKYTQDFFARFNFGPSIFILAKKVE